MKRRIFNFKRKNFPLIWNKPGDNGPFSPKKGPRQDGPPDLEQIIKKLAQRLMNYFPKTGYAPNSSPSSAPFFAPVLTGVLLLMLVISGIYIVGPAERAVVTRLGQYTKTTGPGPHWLLPILESKKIINIEQVSTSDHNGLVLTKDGNIVSIGIAVQYKIGSLTDDVRSYLFNVVNPERSLKLSAESALRQVVGQTTMDEVLTQKRAEIANAIAEQIIDTLKNYKTGIQIIDVIMQYAKPPDEVRASFDEVIKAIADEERLVNHAEAYKNEVLPKAKGTAERLLNEALGYKQETVLIAEGNVQRFNLVLPEFLKSSKVMQTRLYLDTMEDILSKTSKIVVDSSLGNNMIYLPLEGLIPKQSAQEKLDELEQNPQSGIKEPLAGALKYAGDKNQ